MNTKSVLNYRDFLLRYAEVTKKRRPGFSLGSWAKALDLKSTSSLTKVLNGEREAGPELLQKLITYFHFNKLEEAQFRNLVALSKMKESSELKAQLANSLLRHQASKDLKSRLIELDQFELLASYLPLAVRELTRLSKIKISKLARLLPQETESTIQRALHVLSRMNMVTRDSEGHFLATEENVHTEAAVTNEMARPYHTSGLELAKHCLDTVEPKDREFHSLVLLLNSSDLPQIKKKIREFLISIEPELPSEEKVNQLYQIQVQLIPVSKRFEEQELKKQSLTQEET